MAAGASALNMVLERNTDARMLRTRDRPIPSGRVGPGAATIFGSVITLLGLGILAIGSGFLATAVALTTWGSYLFIYTPLKRVTIPRHPGRAPSPARFLPSSDGPRPVVLSIGEACVLFGILFVWQIPHFLAIAWLYRDDYGSGGLKTLSVVDPGGRISGRQAFCYSLALGSRQPASPSRRPHGEPLPGGSARFSASAWASRL